MIDIDEIKLSRYHAEEGDILVCKVDSYLRDADLTRLQQRLSAQFKPLGVMTFVLDKGLTLEVIRTEKAVPDDT